MILSTFKKVALSAGVALAITGSALAAEELKLDTDETKASYGIGYGFAQNLMGQTQGIELSADALAQGIKDAMSEAEMKVPEADVQAAIQVLQQRQMEVAKAKATEAAAAARAEGEAFLKKNAKKDGVTTTDSGLQYEVMTKGDSDEHPSAESTVQVHYHGTLIDGTVFDSSVDRGEPIDFPLNGVIAGWTEGVQLMSPGDKYRFFIPADLAYGDSQASPLIPPGSTLIFEVELLDIL
jgi:FKBP-type peptidyl-prolyl cis-trans isomerase